MLRRSILLYQADCRHIIPMLEYDSVVTDPWYGASAETDVRKEGDGYPEWCLTWFDLLKKPILMTVGNMNTPFWGDHRPPAQWLLWLKPDGTSESVGAWGDIAYAKFDAPEGEIVGKFRTKSIEWALEMVSRVPGRVLDPFMGMGVVGLACKQLGRDFIGIEHDPEIFKVARERLK